VEGWVGGLGIGVTHTHPSKLEYIPDRAWQIPSTFVVGYWGCFFLSGTERGTLWKADEAHVGQRVGMLITGDARTDLVVFVDGEPVVRVDGAVLRSGGLRDAPLYPVVDVFAATLSVAIEPHSVAPTVGRTTDLAGLSPLGSAPRASSFGQ